MTTTLLLIFFAAFLGTFPLVAAVADYRQAYQTRRRLGQLTSASGPAGSYESALLQEPTTADQVLSRFPLTRAIKRKVELSGVKLSALNFLSVTGAVAATGFVVIFVWKQSIWAAIAAALVFASFPFFYLAHLKKRRDAKFAEQLPDALMMIARSLRAGHSLAAAVELISMELPEPSSSLFKTAYEQQKLGVRLVDCLVGLRTRIDSQDFDFFLTIVKINSESGGNLAEILDKLAETIRSRLQIRRQVEVLTAEGRISGYVLVALPAVMFVVFYLIRPGYVDVFFNEPVCQAVLGIAVAAQFAGYLIIKRIVNIEI